MNGDDMTILAALFLVAGLFCMALMMNRYIRALDEPLSSPGPSRAVFAVSLLGTAAALGLSVYDVSVAGPGFRTFMEVGATGGFAMGSLAAYGSMGAAKAKRRGLMRVPARPGRPAAPAGDSGTAVQRKETIMAKRVNQDDRQYDARLSYCDWCRDFGPDDFNGKNVVVRMSGGAVIRGTLTCMGTVDERADDFANSCRYTGCISLEGNGFPVLHDGRPVGGSADLAVLQRLYPDDEALPPTARRWGFAGDVEEVTFVWDEQDYNFIFPERVEPGCVAVVGAGLYPVLAVRDEWVVVDVGVPIILLKDMVAEFLCAKAGRA